jgi:hypothetical protein
MNQSEEHEVSNQHQAVRRAIQSMLEEMEDSNLQLSSLAYSASYSPLLIRIALSIEQEDANTIQITRYRNWIDRWICKL